MSGPTFIGSAYGPTLRRGWELVATADFNGDSRPDYVLYNASTRPTAIWYLNNNAWIGSNFGATLPNGWALVRVKRILIATATQIMFYSTPVQVTQLSGICRDRRILVALLGPTFPAVGD